MTTCQVFRGRTLTEARRAAVQALGGGAVLLTTREVRLPGLAGLFGSTEVEVVATAPTPSTPPATPSRRANPLFALSAYNPAEQPPSEPPPTHASASSSASSSAAAGPSVAALRNELRSELRALKAAVAAHERVPPALMAELAALRTALEEVALEPHGDRAVALLRARGIEGPAATALARALRDTEDEGALPDRLREALAGMIRVAPWPLAGDGRALVALVGPTGVGKTTTIAKLAARARIERRSVTLIACDGFRVGALDQLRRYASLMDARFETAANREELTRCIEDADTDLVMVDTAGSPPKPGGVETLLEPEALARAAARHDLARHVILCVPASLRALDAAAVARAFGPLEPTALAVTKLDETASPAGLVHAPEATGLPVAVLCAGQRVPEHVAPATAGAILDHLVPRAAPGAGA